MTFELQNIITSGEDSDNLPTCFTKINENNDLIEDKINNLNTINVKDFGAKGDGVTDDTNAIRSAIETILSYGTQNNVYTMQTPYILYFPPGIYIISSLLNITFRNYLTLSGYGAWLKWNGSDDALMVDAMGCNHLKWLGLNIHGNNKLGQVLRISGGNDPGYSNKNNATDETFKDFRIINMLPTGTKPFIGTVNDNSDYGDYSIDDSVFDNVSFASAGFSGIELASSEISFNSCKFISVDRGVSYRTGVTARFNSCVFAGVRYPAYVFNGAHIGEIDFNSCYVEAMNRSLAEQGSHVYVEAGTDTSRSVKAIKFRGGVYNQGNKSYIDDTSKYINLNNCYANLYIDGVRWQEGGGSGNIKAGKIDLGVNGHAIINKQTLIVDFADYMPPITGGKVTYSRMERLGSYLVSTPQIFEQVIEVDSTLDCDYFDTLKVRTLDKALDLIDQLGVTQVKILMKNTDSLYTRRFLNGDLRLTGYAGTEVISFRNQIDVKPGGQLIIDNLGLETMSDNPNGYGIINRGGYVRIGSAGKTINNYTNMYTIKHMAGFSSIVSITHIGGKLIDATYSYGMGEVAVTSLTYNSSQNVIQRDGSPIACYINGGLPPATGYWQNYTMVRIPSPSAGGYLGYICTTSGNPGIWKAYAAILN